ncbi:hypothetical protein HY041_00870 [Candidatus Roizmanbacteria bacterium]|nr:hypothetical protein [Candidatus Roizmanbacteria bacterium]
MNREFAVENIRRNFKSPIDVTLREGEQFAGRFVRDDEVGHFENFELSPFQAKRILSNLHRIGIEFAEVPNGLVHGINRTIIELVAMADRPKLLCHIRNNLLDAQAAIELGVDGLNILTFVDPERIARAGYQSLSEYLGVLQQVISLAKEHHLQTRVSVEHAWNGYFDQALNVFEFANDLGVDRIGLPDTLGIANRFDVEDRVTQARKRAPRPDIEVHFHNDGSIAVANAVEALIHGANHVNTTFAGIGERTGITPLSGLLTQLFLLDPNIVKGLHLELLTPAEQEVMDMIGLPVPHNLITAPNAFAHKAGIHAHGIQTHSTGLDLYQPFPADTVGNQSRVITRSRMSGRSTPSQVRAVLPQVIVQ